MATHALLFDDYTLLVFALERKSKETDSEILSRCQHAVPSMDACQRYMRECEKTYWDSVRKTGIVLDSVKF